MLAAMVSAHLTPLVVQPYVVGDVFLPHIMGTLQRAKGTESPVVRSLALALRVGASSHTSRPPLVMYSARLGVHGI